jgi:hypothetical protein
MSHGPLRTAVFLGPSLPLATARQILPARYLPPAGFGDVYRLIGSDVDTLVLIDGFFHDASPVWPRELLAAMNSGIRVFGAASMGAMRAAELCRHGMIGLGTVFRWYERGEIDGDDEAALLHAGPEQGYAAISMPLVNLRYNLREASARGVLPADAAAALVAAMKALPFWRRTLSAMRSAPAYQALDDASRRRLGAFFTEGAIDLKRRDAEDALAEIARRRAEPGGADTPSGPSPFEVPDGRGYYDRFRLLRRGIPRAAAAPLDGQAVVDRAFADPRRRKTLQSALAARFFTRAWAREAGVTWLGSPADAPASPDGEPGRAAGSRADWLVANALSAGEHDELLAHHRLWTWVISGDPGRFGLSATLQDAALWPGEPERGAFGSICRPEELARALPYVAAWCRAVGAAPEPEVEEPYRARYRDSLQSLAARGGTPADGGDYLRAMWALDQGPVAFGFATWSVSSELIGELQITGALGALASAWEERAP